MSFWFEVNFLDLNVELMDHTDSIAYSDGSFRILKPSVTSEALKYFRQSLSFQ